METNAVTKVVTDEISITAKFISDLKMFAITKGLDLVEAIILLLSAISFAATFAKRLSIFWKRAM